MLRHVDLLIDIDVSKDRNVFSSCQSVDEFGLKALLSFKFSASIYQSALPKSPEYFNLQEVLYLYFINARREAIEPSFACIHLHLFLIL
jgi:hypothetical protein